MTITTLSGKGSMLTHEELDANFDDLDLRTKEGWFDLVSPISANGIVGSVAPTATNFGPVSTPQRKEYAFQVNDYVYCLPFHVNHDIKPGGRALVHVHWSTSGTSTNTVKWEFSISRAKGHNQANFPVPTVYTVTAAAHGTAWRHMVSEVSINDALTLTEPDELILVTLRRVTNGGSENNDTVFALMVDFHYETDRHASLNRAPNFYA